MNPVDFWSNNVVPPGMPKSVLTQKCGDVINTQQPGWSWRSEPEDLLSFNTRTVVLVFYKKTKIFSFIFSIMKPTSTHNLSTSKGEFPEALSKTTRSSSCELHPSLIAMVLAQPFLGHDNENPCHYQHEFEVMCSCRRKYEWGLGWT